MVFLLKLKFFFLSLKKYFINFVSFVKDDLFNGFRFDMLIIFLGVLLFAMDFWWYCHGWGSFYSLGKLVCLETLLLGLLLLAGNYRDGLDFATLTLGRQHQYCMVIIFLSIYCLFLLHALEVNDTMIKALKYSIECQKDFMSKEAIRLQREEKMLLIEKLKASNLDQKIHVSYSIYMVLVGAIVLTCTLVLLAGRVG
jgi:hypothetical protein